MITLGLFLFLLISYVGGIEGTAPKDQFEIVRASEIVPLPVLSASSWALFESNDGSIIVGNDVDTPRPIASITKLFTAYSVIATDSLEETTRVEWSDIATEGRAGKLVYGEETSMHDLLFPMLIESSNDAAATIGRSLDSTDEAAISEVLSEWSLFDTTIVDSSGLSPHNQATVRDLAQFYARLNRTTPLVTDITGLRQYIGERTGYINNNPLRALDSFESGKHGYLPEAGKTFVGNFMLEDGRSVGIVLLGSDDLVEDAELLLAYSNSAR